VLAKEKSTDSTLDTGGYMGKLDPASLRPELRNALAGIARGQITSVIQIPSGYAILKVVTEASITETESANRARRAAVDATGSNVNNDGLLDLFVGNENGPAQLFLNKGDGTFIDIAHSAGVDKVAFAKAVVAADYDNDGYPDFYVSNFAGDNFLYHNNHDNTFTDVARQAGVLGPWQSFPTWFFDYDNDGRPDLLVSSYFLSPDESVRTYPGLPHNALTMKLYRNLGNGTFKDLTVEIGLDKVLMPMGANFGDIASLIPHVLLRNHDGKYFADVTAASGTGELHKGHGVAFADMGRNGQEDILTLTGGAVPGDAHAAHIKVTVENEGPNQSQAKRSIYRTVGSGGSFGASPLEQHIGLGKSARITNIEVWCQPATPGKILRTSKKTVSRNQRVYRHLHQARAEIISPWRPEPGSSGWYPGRD